MAYLKAQNAIMGASCFLALSPGFAAAPTAPSSPLVIIHPFLAERFSCSDHYDGQLTGLGDALGTDCTMVVSGSTSNWGGSKNEDYHIWGKAVLAPFDGVVERVRINPVINVPGTLGKPPASSIVFRRADGVRVVLSHLYKIKVSVGDSVRAGQSVAVVGNNGMSTSPHVHIGAWAHETPLQIAWDLKAMAALRKK